MSFRRDYSHLIKAKSEEKDSLENKKKIKPTARRHIFLIRHGQYEMKAETDANRYLTALGKHLFYQIININHITNYTDSSGKSLNTQSKS